MVTGVCRCVLVPRHRLEDIDDKTRVRITRAQIVRRSIKGLAGLALRHMGLSHFLSVVPLKTPTPVPTKEAGVSDDKLWVLKVIR